MAANHTRQKDRLIATRIAVGRKPELTFLYGVMMVGTVSLSERFPTACTNGRDEYYNPEFIATLDDKELFFVVMHETMHKAMRHLTTWRSLFLQNHMLTNMATDYVINITLLDLDPKGVYMKPPKQVLLDQKYRGWDTLRVYNDLLQQARQQPQSGQGKGKGGPNGQDQGDGTGSHGNFDSHDWSGAGELSEAEQKSLEKEIDQALRQGAIAASKIIGKGAGGLSREIDDLLHPQINWTEALREFVTSVCNNKDASSWRRVNRRYLGSDTYMPTMVGECVGKLVIGIDTSGSIGGSELSTFLSEVKAICDTVKPEQIELVYWDAAVAGHETYNQSELDNLISSTKPRGGGGTDVGCLFKYVQEKNLKPECCIVLTDGYTPWCEAPAYPTLFVITSDIVAPFGKTTKISF